MNNHVETVTSAYQFAQNRVAEAPSCGASVQSGAAVQCTPELNPKHAVSRLKNVSENVPSI
jgi:hypothetical protein